MDSNKTIPGICRLMRIREVLQLCGLSRTTLYREIKLRTFPAQVKLSARSVGWLQDDVMRWLDARVAQRGPAYKANNQIDPRDAEPASAIKSDHRQAQDESE
ncbi:AlpA family phage regulatory protein [Rugamonas sp. FT107W]|uniref:AlpA family phage regulatory protein n=1 Tax=Duganella vulcania TaxID=2692166 RepID=A0A845HF02_9BURK|nr:AlpA family transcriptional regulator [Duganella vulcania]MYN17862.1 AlpA family phage regulatory protein [Duganella vulcania]